MLAETLARNRARRDAHELLVERVAREMTRAGRLAWRGLAVRAKVDERLGDGDARRLLDPPHDRSRPTLEPIVHEVKVQRADLLGRPAPREQARRPTCSSAANAGT